MGKVIILGGNARSGKSTLAFKLVKHGFSRISLDNIQQFIEDGLKIEFDKLDYDTKLNFFKNIVDKSLEECETENTNIVIDMYDYLPSDLVKIENIRKTEVYFFAYPNCSKEEIKYNVVHYAKPTDWIAQVNQTYLDECVERFYKRNEILVKECHDYNFKLIDTKSGDERDYVLNRLVLEISK